jgi:hypothetical protein
MTGSESFHDMSYDSNGHNPFGDNDWALTLEKNRSLGLMNSDLEIAGGGTMTHSSSDSHRGQATFRVGF